MELVKNTPLLIKLETKFINMKNQKFLIASGNSTLLVWDYPSWERKQIIERYLGEVEHLGFVSVKNGLPKLTMMGNELCVNATLAFASQCSNKGKLITSGINEPVAYQNLKNKTFIKIPLSYKQIENIVIFSGIGFIYLNERENFKKLLPKLCKKYKLPAFGAILFNRNRLEPYVYVQETKSLCKETACGSGSIAFNILTGLKKITQPTGQVIRVQQSGSGFTVSAKVVKIEERIIL